MAGIDIVRFSNLVRQKRGEKNLREVAQEIGDISISTLSRIEQEKIPDLSTFIRICSWLGMSPNDFTPDFTPPESEHKNIILYHLRADKTLSPEVADTLKKVIELAYDNSRSLINNKNEKRF